MFLLVPAHPGFPGQIPQSRKTVVCVCVMNVDVTLVRDAFYVSYILSHILHFHETVMCTAAH